VDLLYLFCAHFLQNMQMIMIFLYSINRLHKETKFYFDAEMALLFNWLAFLRKVF